VDVAVEADVVETAVAEDLDHSAEERLLGSWKDRCCCYCCCGLVVVLMTRH
jgi:hypothetical protein